MRGSRRKKIFRDLMEHNAPFWSARIRRLAKRAWNARPRGRCRSREIRPSGDLLRKNS